jgi:RimJ/RimL family protein N-acetyltransferase
MVRTIVFRPTRVVLKDGRVAQIRRARPGDAEAVIAHVNAVGAERIYIMTEKLRKTPAQERAVFRQADGRTELYLVAVVHGEIVGTADIACGRHAKNRHTASLGIALRRDAREIGLGTAMMNLMIAWAGSVGVRKLTLGVFATNRRAVALYRKLGFVQEGRLKGQVVLRRRPVDELLLALWI